MTPQGANILKATVWMLGSIGSFTLLGVAGREASLDLDTFEILLYRSLFGIAIVLIIAKAAGTLHQLNTRDLPLHSVRNICHFGGQNLWFYAVTVAPLAQVVALEFTTPLWVTLLAPFVLGERLTSIRALSAVIGFAGVLIVARPDMGNIHPGALTAALSAIFFAGSIMTTKILTRTQSITSILFWLVIIQTGLGLIFAGYDGDIALPSAASLPWVVAIAFGGLTAHFCLTKALTLVPATIAVPLDFGRLPVIAIVGMLLYAEALDAYVFLGAAIIFGANYLNIWRETRKLSPN